VPVPDSKPTDTPATTPAEPAYTLTLPTDSGIDPAVVESTTAILRESKVSTDHGQKVLDHVVSVAKAARESAVAAVVEDHKPGGKAWERIAGEMGEKALADPVLGNGKPEQLEASKGLAKRVVAEFGDAEMVQLFEKDPMSASPAVLRMLVSIGKRMKDDDFVRASPPPAGTGAESSSWLVRATANT
jgi:hypothetical protein